MEKNKIGECREKWQTRLMDVVLDDDGARNDVGRNINTMRNGFSR